jgi:thiol-disulfide isomerase/thioredoxin
MKLLFQLAVLAFIALTVRSLFASPGAGGPAPALHVETFVSAPVDASADLTAHRGKVVVLEFWATWCGPCVQAIPHMNQLVAAFEGQPVVFLAISDEDEETLLEFLDRRDMRAWVASDPDASARSSYGVRSFPTAVVIDREGRVTWTGHPMELDVPRIRALLPSE